MMSFLFCENCGPVDAANTRVIQREETVEVRAEPITSVNSVRLCSVCGASIFDRELDGANIHRAYEIYRERHRLITPDEIVGIRETYGLSQRGLAMLLGLGEVTITRYEGGSLPDEAYSHLLRLLKEPRNMQAIYEERGERLSAAARRKVEKRLKSLLSGSCSSAAADHDQARRRIATPPAAKELCGRLAGELARGLNLNSLAPDHTLPEGVGRAVLERIERADPTLTLGEIAAAAAAMEAPVSFIFSPGADTTEVELHDWDILPSVNFHEVVRARAEEVQARQTAATGTERKRTARRRKAAKLPESTGGM